MRSEPFLKLSNEENQFLQMRLPDKWVNYYTVNMKVLGLSRIQHILYWQVCDDLASLKDATMICISTGQEGLLNSLGSQRTQIGQRAHNLYSTFSNN